MRIHLYTQSLNEAAVLGFFFRHYDPWIERYIVFDDGSKDGTLDLLAQHGRVEIRRFERVIADSFVASAQKLHNTAWMESRGKADWVIITAIDEHLYHPQLPDYLRRCRAAGVTLIPALGYEMVAPEFPPADALLCRSLTLGMPHREMNKLSIFNPNAVESTNYGAGRHSAKPVGDLVFPNRDELLLLHYKHLGLEYTMGRQKILATGMGKGDHDSGWGTQYSAAETKKTAVFTKLLEQASDILTSGRDHHASHGAYRWWRPPYRFVEVP